MYDRVPLSEASLLYINPKKSLANATSFTVFSTPSTRLTEASYPASTRLSHDSYTIIIFFTMADREFISPGELANDVTHRLVKSPLNPGRCPCGRYQYLAICGHVYGDTKFKCGKTLTHRTEVKFCRTPAPMNRVPRPRVNVTCGRNECEVAF